MCGRYTLSGNGSDLGRRYNVDILESLLGSENVKPTFNVPIITSSKDGVHDTVTARWGLVPHWAKHQPNKYTMINAQAESLLEKRTYSGLVKTAERRCLIPADGFYEWMKAEDKKQKSTPFLFSLPNREWFAFAGLWEHWEYEEFGEMTSCTIVTTTPNAEVAPVHGRMPVIFPDRETEEAWLNPELDGGDAVELLLPLPDGRLQVSPVDHKL